MLGLITEEPRAIREAKEEGERKVILRLLNRRVGAIPDALLSQIKELSVERLEALGDALLDFSTLADLEGWLRGEVRG
jgi:predicted transposase YdaD